MYKILYNTKAYLGPGQFAEAVLICNERIRAAGSLEEVKGVAAELTAGKEPALAPEDTVLFDCGGRTLLPGFNDSHMHLMEFGENLRQARVEEAGSIEDLIRICRDFAREHPEAVRTGLHSAGWNQDRFPDHRIPDRHDLDKISTDYPIILERVCGHIISTNTCAIRRLGLTADSPQYADGIFYIGEDGEPNGIFAGNACLYARKLIPEFSDAQRLDILEDAMKYAASRGVTSVQSNDVGAMSGTAEANFDLFRRLYETGRGAIRYRHQVNFETFEEFCSCVETGEYARAKAGLLYVDGSEGTPPLLTLGPLKLYKDGSLGARTALMKKGYLSDPDHHGLEWYSEEDMLRFCRYATEHGIQVVTHYIGDDAVDKVTDCYIRCNRNLLKTEKNPLRHGLVHCQITDPQTLEKIAAHDIYSLVQPVFLEADVDIVEGLIGPELASTSYAFGTLIRTCGERVSFGTDCPVEDCDPFANLYAAILRKKQNGMPSEGFYPEECVSVEEAIDAYTLGSASAEFMEDQLGRIRPGYLADLILLDTDIFTCPPEDIKSIRPVMTMVNGRVVYRDDTISAGALKI